MPDQTLPLAMRLEKNKISTDSATIYILDVLLPTPFYIANNNENITWNNQVYTGFPFTIGDYTDDGKESPSIQIKISNIDRRLGVLVSSAKGAGGTEIVLRALNYKLVNGQPMTSVGLEEYFQITKTNVDAYWVTITIGVTRELISRFPMRTVFRDFCQYRFKDIECGYNGTETVCNKTLVRCRELGNSKRFNGEPALPGN